VAETVPKSVSWYELTEIFMHLVDEEVGIGDVGRILRALSQSDPDVHDTVLLAERVRHALSGQITAQFMRGRATLPVILLEPEIEALFSSALQRTPTGAYLALDPQITQDVLIAVREQLRLLGPGAGDTPILTEVEIRRYIRKLVELEFPSLHVLSRQDLEPDTPIQVVTRIRLDRTPPRTL
jgi:type III secretion protein V